ncbi:MAG: FG-GAP repeat domain-containing protein, partial [Fimbriimonadales bacterium]
LGSNVTISTIDPLGSPIGLVYNTQTSDDQGSFGVTFLYRGYVDLEAQGYYYDEVNGALSTAPIVLRALYDVTSGGQQSAYVNIVTHLAHARALALMAGGGITLEAAETQAESELVAALGIGGAGFNPGGVGINLNELGTDDDANAYLFAVSAVLVQAAREQAREAGSVDGILQELIDTIAASIASGGSLPAALVGELKTAEQDLDVDLTIDLFHYRLQAIGSTATPADLNRAIDSDGDGYRNSVDTCPLVANPVQTQIPAGALCRASRRTTFLPAGWGGNSQAGLVVGDFETTGHAGLANAYSTVGVDGGYAALVGVLAGDGKGRFGSSVTSAFPSGVGARTAFDINQDGKLDLASNDGWFPGDGAGHFGNGIAFPFVWVDGGSPPSCAFLDNLVLAHFDDAGAAPVDIALTQFNTYCPAPSVLQVSLGTGPGTFAAPTLFSMPGIASTGWPLGLHDGDVNQDGILDLVVVSEDRNTNVGAVVAMLGDGTGGFAAASPASFVSFGTLDSIYGSVLADFDGDGHLDAAAYGQRFLDVAFGDGAGGFGSVTTTAISNGDSFPLVAGDFNADGKADVAGLLGSPGNVSSATVSVLVSTGRAFGAPQVLRSGPVVYLPQFTSLAEGDVNGDGVPDAVVLGPDSAGNDFVQVFLMNVLQ